MAAHLNSASLRFDIAKSLVSLCLIASGTLAYAQTISVRLVDGRNGRPMTGASSYVNVWVGTQRKEAIATPTDGEGVARLQLTLNPDEVNVPNSTGHGTIIANHPVVQYDESFRINVPYGLCRSGEENNSPVRLKNFSTREVLDHGYASGNTCGKATATPKPGQVVLFVRPLTLREKLNQ